jgi:hypothetical protein
MFTNVSVNGVIFQVASMLVVENGFKVVGITANNTAEEIVVNFSNDFGVQFTPVKVAKVAKVKAENPTMTIEVTPEPAKRRGRPAGSKNTPKVDPIVAAEVEYFGATEEVAQPVKRGRGRPRKVVTE